MKHIFEHAMIGRLPLKNRIIRSATFEFALDENDDFSANLLSMYEKMANNEVAAIITGMVAVEANSRVRQSMIKTYAQTFVQELTQVAERMHKLGTKLIVQINHCGQKAARIDGGGPLLGPCDTENTQGEAVKGMSHEDIRSVTANFAAAAVRCKQAGADAVQIHAAHGYLLSQFLNPCYNKRVDEYGETIQGRARIVLEIYEAVRAAVGSDYPVWIKINSRDLTEESISTEEFL